MDRALKAYDDWREYGPPESGGSREWPAIWHVWMRTIKAAIRDADEDRLY